MLQLKNGYNWQLPRRREKCKVVHNGRTMDDDRRKEIGIGYLGDLNNNFHTGHSVCKLMLKLQRLI